MARINNPKGQALLEALVATPVIVCVVTGTLVIASLAYTKLAIQFTVYRGTVCIAEKNPINYCKRKFKSMSLELVPFGKMKKYSLDETRRSWKGLAQWKLLQWNINAKFTLQKNRIQDIY